MPVPAPLESRAQPAWRRRAPHRNRRTSRDGRPARRNPPPRLTRTVAGAAPGHIAREERRPPPETRRGRVEAARRVSGIPGAASSRPPADAAPDPCVMSLDFGLDMAEDLAQARTRARRARTTGFAAATAAIETRLPWTEPRLQRRLNEWRQRVLRGHLCLHPVIRHLLEPYIYVLNM